MEEVDRGGIEAELAPPISWIDKSGNIPNNFSTGILEGSPVNGAPDRDGDTVVGDFGSAICEIPATSGETEPLSQIVRETDS